MICWFFQLSELFSTEANDQLVLDFDTQSKKAIISVDRKLVKHLKPHQKEGIKFMWDACYESCENINVSTGGGCILAHCMGLGE